jgi:hypothetical protein
VLQQVVVSLQDVYCLLAVVGGVQSTHVACQQTLICALLSILSRLRFSSNKPNLHTVTSSVCKPHNKPAPAAYAFLVACLHQARACTEPYYVDSAALMSLLHGFRVPKDVLPKQDPNANPHYAIQHKTRMALVWHEKTSPREGSQQQQQAGRTTQQQQQRQRMRQPYLFDPYWDDSDSYGDDSDTFSDEVDRRWEERLQVTMGYDSNRPERRSMRFGQPQLVLIPELHLHGGDAADKAVRKVRGSWCAQHGALVVFVCHIVCMWCSDPASMYNRH